MDIKQLQYFVVSVNLGSFHAAAEALITTQPNVSKVVKSLEEDLQMNLLERNRSGVRVSGEGEVIYRYAVNVLKNMQLIHEKKSEKHLNKLSIGKTPGIELDFITAKFCSLYGDQNLRLHYQEERMERIMVQVHRRAFELGFLYLPRKSLLIFEGQIKGKGLTFCELARTPLYLFAGPGNHCYQQPWVTETAIHEMKLVQQNEDLYSLHHQLPQLQEDNIEGLKKGMVTHTNNNHFLIQLLRSTDYGSVGSGLGQDKYQEYGIRAIPVKGYEACVSFGYLKRTRSELSPIADSFLRFIEEQIREPS